MDVERDEGFSRAGIMCLSSPLFLLQRLPCHCHASGILSKTFGSTDQEEDSPRTQNQNGSQEASGGDCTSRNGRDSGHREESLENPRDKLRRPHKASLPVGNILDRDEGGETAGCLCLASSGQPPMLLSLPAHGGHSSTPQAEESPQSLHTVDMPYMSRECGSETPLILVSA